MNQESYKQRPMHTQRQPGLAPGNIAGYPAPEAALTKSEPEIFLAVNYLNKRQDDLTCQIEKLAVKLGPVMRQPCPQEQCEDNDISNLPESELGRALQEIINGMYLQISTIKELNDRTCL